MTVKYAGQLSALDLNHEIRYLKKYRYGGQDKERVITMPIVIRIWHTWDVKPANKGVETTITYRKSKYSSMEYETLSPLTEVEVVDAD